MLFTKLLEIMCSLQTLVYWLIGLAIADVIIIMVVLAVNTKLDQLNDQITERTHNDLQKTINYERRRN